MMATTAMQLAIDAFGPIADNAAELPKSSELQKCSTRTMVRHAVTQLLRL
jgi:Na+/H+-translocating membrane pyrophosphatase